MTSLGRSSIVLITGLLGALLASCGSEPEQVGRTGAPITHGAPASGDPAVVGVVYPVGQKRIVGCSGALVASDRVLTAAHCVTPMAPESILIGESFAEGVEHAVAAIMIHPEYEASTLRADLALLELAEPTEVTPLVLEPGAVLEGTRVRLVGFGRGEVAAPPRKRAGTARVSSVKADTFTIEPDPSLSCSGDSGGPAFADDGEPRFVGIASKGDWECAQHATYTHAHEARFLLDEPSSRGPACSVLRPGARTSSAALVMLLLSMITLRWRRRS